MKRAACRRCGGELRDSTTPKGLPLRWCPACHSAAKRKWRSAHPGANRAHHIVARAIAKGVLKREPCVICGDMRSEFHHTEGYAAALTGIFLCRVHHRQAHRKPR